jgi:photosystem II stability/assembly factor-like uncharacterized protein
MPLPATFQRSRARWVGFPWFLCMLPVRSGHPRDSREAVGTFWRGQLGVLVLAPIVALWPAVVAAHDPSAWGGLFRTRDAGVTWLHVNPGSFVSGALALAVSPMDPNHLLLATDSGVSRSRNGGRDWEVEGPGVLIGPAFAAAFDVDGEGALVSGASALFRNDGGRWRPIQTPSGATPARALVSGSVRGRVYLAGRTGLFRSDDWGRSWLEVSGGLPAEHVSVLAVPPDRPEEVYAVVRGQLWASNDGARNWRLRDEGLPASGVEAVGLDPSDSTHLWAVAAGQAFRSDDQGRRWRPVGVPVPARPVVARAVAGSGHVIVIASDRGVYRSPDEGKRWELPNESLPAHLEAGLLVKDPLNAATLYAGFALIPAEELRQRLVQGGRAFARRDGASLARGVAFLVLLGLGAGAVLRRLARTSYRGSGDRPAPAALARIRRTGHMPR